MLRSVDAEFVKLDPSIVIAAPTEPSARAVLMAMATFARQTGAFVIAEGIEDEETLAVPAWHRRCTISTWTRSSRAARAANSARPSPDMPSGVPAPLRGAPSGRRATV